MISDIVTWVIPFASGAAGVYAGLKVGIARLEANYINLRTIVEAANHKLEGQVGETRCERYREDCQERIEKTLDRIEAKVDRNKEFVTDEIRKIAVYMAKHNGD